MPRFVETIALMEGVPLHLEYHQKRFDRTRREMLGIDLSLPLFPLFESIPREFTSGLVKTRILYDRLIESVEFHPYQFKNVNSLRIVETEGLDYRYKYLDRCELNSLFQQKRDCDDIMIVNNGFLSDASSSNLLFYDGSQLISPLHSLLPGTCRDRLVKEGMIRCEPLTIKDLNRFKEVHLINAFRNPGDCVLPRIQIFTGND